MQAVSGLIDDVRIYNAALIAGEVVVPARQAAFEREQTPNIAKGLTVGNTLSPSFTSWQVYLAECLPFPIFESWQIRRQNEEGSCRII